MLLTYKEMWKIAQRGGIVQWTASKRIERLRVSGMKVVCIHALKGKHVLRWHDGEYKCRELGLDEMVSLGDLAI